MASSLEYRTFQKIYCDLKDGLQSGIGTIADRVFSKELISETVKIRVTSVFMPEDDRASSLLSSIHQRIKGDKSTYYKFADILEETMGYDYLAKKMRKEINQMSEVERPVIRLHQLASEEKGTNWQAFIVGTICLGLALYLFLFPVSPYNIQANSAAEENCGLQVYEEIIQQNLPKLSGPFFGRTSDLKKLEDYIFIKLAKVVNINGPPAFGKSSLAIKFAKTLLVDHLDSIHTVRHIDTETTRQAWYLCSDTTVEDAVPLSSHEENKAVTKNLLHHGYESNKDSSLCQWASELKQRAVVILDNCEHILSDSRSRKRFLDVINSLYHKQYVVTIIVSQEQLFLTDAKFFSLHVKELSQFDSREMLKHYVPDLGDDNADVLSDAVGHCPLALKVVGKLLELKGVQYFKSLLKKLRYHSVHTLSSKVSRDEERLRTIMDVAYNHLDKHTQKCCRVLSLFPGSTSYEVEKHVMGSIIPHECIEDVVRKSFIEETLVGDEIRHSMHKLIRDYLREEHPVNSKARNQLLFSNSFVAYYTKYLKKTMVLLYGGTKERLNDKESFIFNHLETHNIELFGEIALMKMKENPESAGDIAVALGLLIQEDLIPTGSFEKYHISAQAYLLYKDVSVYAKLCTVTSDRICTNILWKAFVSIAIKCTAQSSSEDDRIMCSLLFDCHNLGSFAYRETYKLIEEYVKKVSTSSSEKSLFDEVDKNIHYCKVNRIWFVKYVINFVNTLLLEVIWWQIFKIILPLIVFGYILVRLIYWCYNTSRRLFPKIFPVKAAGVRKDVWDICNALSLLVMCTVLIVLPILIVLWLIATNENNVSLWLVKLLNQIHSIIYGAQDKSKTKEQILFAI